VPALAGLFQVSGELAEPAVGRCPDRARPLVEDPARRLRVQPDDDTQQNGLGLFGWQRRDQGESGIGGDSVQSTRRGVIPARQVAKLVDRDRYCLGTAPMAAQVVGGPVPGDRRDPAAETV
jgi:hypothetical protein